MFKPRLEIIPFPLMKKPQLIAAMSRFHRVASRDQHVIHGLQTGIGMSRDPFVRIGAAYGLDAVIHLQVYALTSHGVPSQSLPSESVYYPLYAYYQACELPKISASDCVHLNRAMSLIRSMLSSKSPYDSLTDRQLDPITFIKEHLDPRREKSKMRIGVWYAHVLHNAPCYSGDAMQPVCAWEDGKYTHKPKTAKGWHSYRSHYLALLACVYSAWQVAVIDSLRKRTLISSVRDDTDKTQHDIYSSATGGRAAYAVDYTIASSLPFSIEEC